STVVWKLRVMRLGTSEPAMIVDPRFGSRSLTSAATCSRMRSLSVMYCVKFSWTPRRAVADALQDRGVEVARRHERERDPAPGLKAGGLAVHRRQRRLGQVARVVQLAEGADRQLDLAVVHGGGDVAQHAGAQAADGAGGRDEPGEALVAQDRH